MSAKILVLDDDPDLLDSLKLILEDAGYMVLATTKDGKFVDDKVKDGIDLVILDVVLSGQDGREICKRIRSNKLSKDKPVIMISAYPDAKKSSLAAGANAFLSKPFEIDDLLGEVERQVN